MRFPRYQRDFVEASRFISDLKKDPDDFSLLLEFHKFLIRKIVKEEKRIHRLKKARSRLKKIKGSGKLNKIKSKGIKEVLKKIDPRLRARRELIVTWRFFGDGIANIYVPNSNLKVLYYDDDYNVKEDAGFISGKEGFRQEWKVFKMGLQYNVPVVLSDITNVIRHGDVCALGMSDPVPIEVKRKMHKNPGARVSRQLLELQKLSEFYRNDYAPSFKNGLDAYRVENRGEEITYYEDINYLIKQSLIDGYASKEVEKGLVYFCVRTDLPKQQLENAMKHFIDVDFGESTLIHSLTPEEDWGTAYPFTLSLEKEALVAFLQNDISICILTDLQEVRAEFLRNNVHAVFIMDGQSAIQICLDPNDLTLGVQRISEQYFNRAIIGFNSLKAFSIESSRLLHELSDPRQKVVDVRIKDSILNVSMLNEWSNVKDVLIKKN
ncbi:TPA: hypothetical protein KI784_002584 [Escherichia coli]|jgi:hypothetical protein|uniref:hypothetical protein n=1 Tax=Enterobacteriaceae TaxID=543 RepID=UPI00094FAE4F|nr:MULTISPECIES: hypothetical protein [Enterobacteriaceae]ELY4417777.1 hypothetical protein [Cronobacter sakazakii]HBZ7474581.1 hypothetical protein [Klebsiella pneumoniae]MDD8627267.1 hypothetical protein [Escherichia coli]RTP38296.1 hypothetical protein EKN42_17510 [Enterobacter hormaechei]BDZ96768.1 hypothetical protein VEE06_10650 [Escherichia coli]